MAKIELSLESNINLITASGLFGYKLKEAELTPLVSRICKNFYNHYSEDLAHTVLGIWHEHLDRKNVHAVLVIAHAIEIEWRQKNPLRFTVLSMCNPHSFDPVSYNQLLALNPASEIEIRNKLSCLSEADFEATPYYKCIRSTLSSYCGGKCMMRISGIPCESTQDLTILYLSREHARGLEHRHHKEDITIVCQDCKERSQLVGQNVI